MKFRLLAFSVAGDSPRGTSADNRSDSPQAPAGQPSFRSAIDVVSMNVTVTDSTSRYVTDLTEKDFEVFEDGVKQELTLFNRSNLPVALSLLIDTSSSMEDRMTTAQDAAIGFVRKLRPTDLGEVIGFDSRAEVLQKFTSNTGRARAGDPQDRRRRLDVDEQRALHLVEGPEEDSGAAGRRDPPSGDRPAVGR